MGAARFVETTPDGPVIVTGRGEGASEGEARERARERALRLAAESVSARVESDFEAIEKLSRAEQGGEIVEESSLTRVRSRLRVRTDTVVRGGRQHGLLWREERDGGGFVCYLRLEFPANRLYPQERLARLARSEQPPAERAEAALRLADVYSSEEEPGLALLAAELAARWAPASPRPLRILADLLAAEGDRAGELLALGRLAPLLEGTPKAEVEARAGRLRQTLVGGDVLIERLLERARRRRDPTSRRRFSLTLERGAEPGRLDATLVLGRPGYVTCLWIDEDGIGEWTPTRCLEGTPPDCRKSTRHWEAGEHAIRGLESRALRLRLVSFLTATPRSFRQRGLAPARSVPAGAVNEEALREWRRLERLCREAEHWVDESDVWVDAIEIGG